MFFLATEVPYGGGLVVNTTGIVLGGVLTAIIIGMGTYIITTNTVRKKEKKEDRDVLHAIDTAIRGKPSDGRSPAVPGISEVVMGDDGKGGLVGSVEEIRALQATQGEIQAKATRILDEHTRQLKALARDIKPHDGMSTRDAVDRIESQTKRARSKRSA